MYAYIMYFTSYFVIAIAFYLRKKALSQSALPTKITYDYWAKSVTNKIDVDSLYSFIIEKCYDGYRVYINRVPNLFISRDKTNYNPHLYKEKSNNMFYICWTNRIKRIDDAKTLARLWADATQQFVETGSPANGFLKEKTNE